MVDVVVVEDVDVVEDDGGVTVDDVVVVVGGGGPDETTRFTGVPGATCVPTAGVVEMTVPAPYWVDDDWVMFPTLSPTWPRVTAAWVWLTPASPGTDTWVGPVDTTRATVPPWEMEVPEAGSELMTLPLVTVVLAWLVVVYSSLASGQDRLGRGQAHAGDPLGDRRPAPTMATERATDVPFFTSDPLAGSVPRHGARGSSVDTSDWTFTTRPSAWRVEVAVATGWPTTSGTLSVALPPR